MKINGKFKSAKMWLVKSIHHLVPASDRHTAGVPDGMWQLTARQFSHQINDKTQ